MHLLLVLCSLVAAVWGQGTTTTVLDYLTSRRYTTLVNLIDQAGLTDTLKGAGPFTIFAPSNSALRNVDTSDKAKLADILKYHVVSGSYNLDDLYNERVFDTLKQNAQIRVNHYSSVGAYTIQGQSLTRSGYAVSNGVVYFINGVMTPPAGTVLDILSSSPNTTTLLKAVQTAGLDTFLQDQNPITVFAPSNKAFDAIGADGVNALLANPTLLASILKYHVIPGTLYQTGYHAASLHTFEEADQLRLHRFFIFGYEVDSGTATGPEIDATNGVVHVTDHVLIPKSLASQVSALTASVTTAMPVTTGMPLTTVTMPIAR